MIIFHSLQAQKCLLGAWWAVGAWELGSRFPGFVGPGVTDMLDAGVMLDARTPHYEEHLHKCEFLLPKSKNGNQFISTNRG